ncbi:MAG: hypothetical protein M1819_003019 [Sarea resinae]|nr:MAG: hypothetical protein M1819_003019 [Sarea resinae]
MDKMDNDAGSYALLKTTVPRDSGVAAKLRAAGAIILGKSNMSQWANFRSDNSSNGWSALEGQTYGPYHPDQDPSGSSSGSAVASAIGLAFAALGTETDGSIVSPSEFNNVVGIKPTVGLTSRSLVIPVSPRQDTVGPIARTVKDAAYILQAIAGKDPYDNYTSAIPFTSLPNYVAACKSDCLQGVRIGVPRNAITIEKPAGPVLAAFEAAITVLKSAGAIIVDHADFTAYQQFEDSKSPDTVLGADFVSALPQYLSELTSNPQNVNDVDSIRKFTQGFPSEGYPGRNTATWDDAIALGFNNTDPRFWAAYQENLYLGGEGGVLGALRRHDLSALILPTDLASNLPALIGTPLITVPLGFYPPNAPIVKSQPRMDLIEAGPNIPFGLSFLGPAWSEASLISFAYAYEQRTQTRNMVHPYIAPQTELCDIVG